MTRAAAILALAMVAAAMPAAASACSPAVRPPSPVPVRGPDCALSVDLNEIDTASLGSAVALGGGLVLQPLIDGNGCYNRQNLLVHDCTAGQVMVIGTEHFALMEAMGRDPDHVHGLERIRVAALAARDAGETRTLDDFAAMSRAEGYGEPLVIATRQALQFGDRRLPLDCACRMARRGG